MAGADAEDKVMLQAIRIFRRNAYFWAKMLGDVQAVLAGRVVKRIGWRVTGKMTGRWLGALWR